MNQPMVGLMMPQKVTAMVNRYLCTPIHPDGSEGPVIAFAKQKRLKLREEVTFDLVPWQFQFDFRTTDGEIVLTSERELKVRDHYRLSLPAFAGGRQLDWRVAAAVGVALDAFQGR